MATQNIEIRCYGKVRGRFRLLEIAPFVFANSTYPHLYLAPRLRWLHSNFANALLNFQYRNIVIQDTTASYKNAPLHYFVKRTCRKIELNINRLKWSIIKTQPLKAFVRNVFLHWCCHHLVH